MGGLKRAVSEPVFYVVTCAVGRMGAGGCLCGHLGGAKWQPKLHAILLQPARHVGLQGELVPQTPSQELTAEMFASFWVSVSSSASSSLAVVASSRSESESMLATGYPWIHKLPGLQARKKRLYCKTVAAQ